MHSNPRCFICAGTSIVSCILCSGFPKCTISDKTMHAPLYAHPTEYVVSRPLLNPWKLRSPDGMRLFNILRFVQTCTSESHDWCPSIVLTRLFHKVHPPMNMSWLHFIFCIVSKRLPCVIPIPVGRLVHDGHHSHSTERNAFHFCEKR